MGYYPGYGHGNYVTEAIAQNIMADQIAVFNRDREIPMPPTFRAMRAKQMLDKSRQKRSLEWVNKQMAQTKRGV